MHTRYFKGKSNDLPAGTVSEVSWDNPVVAQAMRLIFKPREHEKMVEVFATEDGLRAYFRCNPAPPSSEKGGG